MNNLQHVVNRTRHMKTSCIAFQCVIGNPTRVTIHPAQRSRLQHPWQKWNLPRKPNTESCLIKPNELMAKIAEGIRRSEKDQSSYPMSMASRKHHRDSAPVGVTSDIGLIQAQRVHALGHSVSRRFQTGIEPRNTL